MDSETRELRALEAEVAALQRECRMLQNPGEKTSGPWYVDRIHSSLRPMHLSTRQTYRPSDSSGLPLLPSPVLNNVVGDVLKCELESIFCEGDDLRV